MLFKNGIPFQCVFYRLLVFTFLGSVSVCVCGGGGGGGGGGDISVHEIFSHVVTLKIEIVKMSKCTPKCTTKEDHNTIAVGNG